jgi:predicted DNA-binding transcriptional regulator AlpA
MLLSQKEVAAKLGVSSRTIRNWRRHGQFPQPLVNMSNRRFFWTREQFENWLRNSKTFGGKNNPS